MNVLRLYVSCDVFISILGINIELRCGRLIEDYDKKKTREMS
jgi:hypothetical protein